MRKILESDESFSHGMFTAISFFVCFPLRTPVQFLFVEQ